MKPGDCAAGNRDKTKRENLPGDNRAGPIDKAADGWHLQVGQNHENTEGEGEDCAQLHERAEIIARCEQKPDWNNAGGQAISDQRPGQRNVLQAEQSRQRRGFVDQFATPDGQQQAEHTKDRSLHDFPDSPKTKIAAHDHGNRDSGAHRKHTPGTFRKRLHNNQGQHGEQYHHYCHDRDDRQQPGGRIQFLLHHLRERFSIPPQRSE